MLTSASLPTALVDQHLPRPVHSRYVTRLMGRVGLTRRRAECLIRLWAYLWLKHQHQIGAALPPSLERLEPTSGWVPCTCREAAALFYGDQERGSDRSAGMMLDKLVALGLLHKWFDGNTLNLAIPPLPELVEAPPNPGAIAVQPDLFDPRCDTIPVATLWAAHYTWMNPQATAQAYRIAELLRQWSHRYPQGLRVLRRQDTLNPVGFYLLFPVQQASEIRFFGPASKGLYLGGGTSDREAVTDPFQMATPGDMSCRAIFIRSWIIAPEVQQARPPGPSPRAQFLRDAQDTLGRLRQDFPNLCDLHTLMIHPGDEPLARSLGFQPLHPGPQASIYWMYLALDRFLALAIPDRI